MKQQNFRDFSHVLAIAVLMEQNDMTLFRHIELNQGFPTIFFRNRPLI